MTYQLTQDEFDLVRDMVRTLVNARATRDFLSTDEEQALFRLAEQLDPIIR